MQHALLIIPLTALLAIAAALLYTSRQTRIYEAEARLLVVARSSSDGDGGLETPVRIYENEIAVLRSQELLDAVVAQLGHVPDVSFGQVRGTDVLTITTRGTRPARIAMDANVYGEAYVATRVSDARAQLDGQKAGLERDISSIDGRLAGLIEDPAGNESQVAQLDQQRVDLQAQLDDVNAAIASPNLPAGARLIAIATAPTDPVSPAPRKNAAIGLAVGLWFGVVIWLLYELVVIARARPRRDAVPQSP